MRILRPFLLLLSATILGIGSGDLLAQDCNLILNRAQRDFEEGLLRNIPGNLNPCLNRFEKKTDKVAAYKIIILSYIYRDMTTEAEESFQRLLVIDKEYRPLQSDPIEFWNIFRKFRIEPLFTIGVAIKGNTTPVRTGEEFQLSGETDVAEETDYLNASGIEVGLRTDYLIKNNLRLETGVSYLQSNYTVSERSFTGASSQNSTNYKEVSFIERNNFIQVPITFDIVTNIKSDFRPYLTLGAYANYLFSARRTNIETSIDLAEQSSLTSLDQSITALRTPVRFGWSGGAGIKYRVPNGFISLGAEFQMDMNFHNDPALRYIDSEMIYKHGYLDDNFYLNRISIGIGYVYSLYKPKLIR